MTATLRPLKSTAMAVSLFGLLAACQGPFDLDLRGGLGQSLDTSAAATSVTARRPQPDSRGVISYPNYQVALARRGDTLDDVAQRVGISAAELSEYNAIDRGDRLRAGEVIALPRRIGQPADGSGQVVPPSDVDITSLAGNAINNAAPTVATETLEPTQTAAPVPADAQVGYEPIRHTVQRGETAFTIARLYNVPVRSLAEWNGLGTDFSIRENQILLIPPAQPSAPASSLRPQTRTSSATSAPGQGSVTPVPPSAAKPLPKNTSAAAASKPASPDLSKTQTAASSAKMGYPVDGKIIRAYSKGKNNGIDISAPAGSSVKSAADGTVAAITTDADDVTIVVVRHPGNIMTVYYNVDGVTVAKGSSVKRGQKIAAVPGKDSYVHFEVRKGFDSVDPMPYLQ
ncbi:peptidoglycan DD-metalloendopeptidase family protein [Cognatishimia sp. SS12]|uniref:peptidoglycan DD-metalloendopeptidase family protein n=1 Tax=Cognatishimia sp. SS12 TaxID=2979465 RepID=UPI00232CAEBD|nr:peptidoglycan DD-metalloendopeptidase family protein [Cognatishimia sp. SS12]MDC0737411.1 peptidoglycan DD-metalloendopeptidase family protein [Cognatishimia sp. SS12]